MAIRFVMNCSFRITIWNYIVRLCVHGLVVGTNTVCW